MTLTKAQNRALALLSVGPLKRNRDGWITAGGQFVALNTIAKLRKLGKVRLSDDKRWAHPAARTTAGEPTATKCEGQ